jgi:diguanylate cyclase (GGDEF)-like protein
MSSQAYARNPETIQDFETFEVNSIFKGISNMVKRVFDILMALTGLIILAPFFVFIAILIKRDSPGPVFFWGNRVGRNGVNFKILKFRTMYDRKASYEGPRVTSKGDARITPFGGWLRDTKINEFPQLWNVLIGEMSLVGPRPEDPEIAKDWPDKARAKILSIRPGITSPASVLYHDEENMLSGKNTMGDYYLSILPDKLRLDALYVNHHSFFSDLDTIFWTAAVLIPRFAGARIPEGNFFAGPFSRFGHNYITWFAIDLVETLFVVGLTAVLWRNQLPDNWSVEYVLILGIILAFLFSGMNSITRLNRVVWSHATGEDIIGLIISGSTVTALIMTANILNMNHHLMVLQPLPTGMIIVIGLISQACFVVSRYRLRLVAMIANRWLNMRRGVLSIGDRVLVVGDGEAGQIATWLLGRQMFRGAFSIAGIVNDKNITQYGMKLNGNWMLGSLKDVPVLINKYDIGVILFAGSSSTKEENEYIFDICQENQLRLLFLNDLMLMVDRQVTQPSGSFQYPIWLDKELEYKAMHNSVTGLPNRFLFQDRLKHSLAYAKRYKTLLAVLLVKINGVEEIGDEMGRKYSEQMLMEAAERLKKCVRESDTVALVTENVFAVMLQNISKESDARIVARKMLCELADPITLQKLDIPFETEIKIITDLENYDDLETLCKADMDDTYEGVQKREALKWYDNAVER